MKTYRRNIVYTCVKLSGAGVLRHSKSHRVITVKASVLLRILQFGARGGSNMKYERRMVITAEVAGWMALIGLGGCSARAHTQPKIVDLVYAAQLTPVQDHGTTTVDGTVDIVCENREIDSIRTAVYNARGEQVAESVIHLADASLHTSNTLAFLVLTAAQQRKGSIVSRSPSPIATGGNQRL